MMTLRVLSPRLRNILYALQGAAQQPSGRCQALHGAKPWANGVRRSSQLSPSDHVGNNLVATNTGKHGPKHAKYPKGSASDALRRLPDLKEATDVSSGSSKYKVLFSKFDISFYNNDGTALGLRRFILPNMWLRDCCRCPNCVNPETMQRSFNIFAVPLPVRALDVQVEHNGMRVTWAEENHESFYAWSFIDHYLQQNVRPAPPRERELWGAEIKENPPTVTFTEVMDSESGLARMTSLVMKLGFVFVDDTPSSEAFHTKKLLERIGPIRETHYGGFYDFVPDMSKADTAYTNIALAAHTDTTYFTDPVGLQAFHLLSHTPSRDSPDATGGQSLLVDGFRAAEILRKSHPVSFQQLTSKGLPWHASGNKGVTITPQQLYPVIKVENNKDRESPLKMIRWNADDRGVLPLEDLRQSSKAGSKWYAAASQWDQILRSEESEYWFQLRPGRTVIFDNHRILHGRSAFTGLRRICGGYISMDDFISCWRNTNFPREEVLRQVIG